jgi:hypothetical protein
MKNRLSLGRGIAAALVTAVMCGSMAIGPPVATAQPMTTPTLTESSPSPAPLSTSGPSNAPVSDPVGVAAAPGNDAFAVAQLMTGALPITASGTNMEATKEAGEPDHAGSLGGVSVWFTWTPTESSRVVIETCGSGFDTLLGVYTGATVGALSVVAGNDDSCLRQSSVAIAVTAGTALRIAVDGFDGEQGAITLIIRTAPAGPPNDNFADAQVLAGDLPLTATGLSNGATWEPGEPQHPWLPGTGSSVWYRWTPAVTEFVAIGTCGSGYDTLLLVYTGSVVSALTPVAGNDDGCGGQSRVGFTATAGIVYSIAVAGIEQGEMTVTIQLANQPPANDSFGSAQQMTGSLPIQLSGTNVDATKELEPNHGRSAGGASVWYQWDAARSGGITVDTCGSTFDTLLGVYTGASPLALTSVVQNDDACGAHSGVTFAAVEGTTYRIAVDGFQARQGEFTLRIQESSLPGTDGFADAPTLAGSPPITTYGTTIGATSESGEPHHAGSPDTSSIWYRWTPAASDVIVMETCDSLHTTSTMLGVYTGTELAALTEVTSNQSTAGCGTFTDKSRVTLRVTAGTTYRIAVATSNQPALQGDFTLTPSARRVVRRTTCSATPRP